MRRQSLLPQNGLHYKLFFYKQLQAENWQKKAKAKQQPEAEFLPKMSKRTIVSASIRLFD